MIDLPVGKKPLQVLFSTTRGWNCGDEFILRGIRSLVADAGIAINPLIYNRHPDLMPEVFFRSVDSWLDTKDGRVPINLEAILSTIACRADNSLRSGHDLDFVDLCIFAGTPEWLGLPLKKLTDKLLPLAIPVLYLGVGYGDYQQSMGNDPLDQADATMLKRAGLITVRDRMAQAFLKRRGILSHLLPCPALFACDSKSPAEEVRRVAISLQNPHGLGPQTVTPEVNRWLLDFARLAAEAFEVVFVLHNIDEFAAQVTEIRSLGPVFYSYDPKDYEAFYRSCDITVTSRVHGAGICASMGIPAFYVNQSSRNETVSGFLSETVSLPDTRPQDLLNRLKIIDLRGWAQRIISHKDNSRRSYLSLLNNFFAQGTDCGRIKA